MSQQGIDLRFAPAESNEQLHGFEGAALLQNIMQKLFAGGAIEPRRWSPVRSAQRAGQSRRYRARDRRFAAGRPLRWWWSHRQW